MMSESGNESKARSSCGEKMSLRLATMSDLRSICEDIVPQVVQIMNNQGNWQWNHTYPLEADFIADIDSQVLWVGEIEGKIVGFIAITTDQPEEYAVLGLNTNEISIVPHRLAVSPTVRNQGIASTFMTLAEDQALKRGIKQVRVDTNTMNAAMNHILVKLGYNHKGQFSFTKRGGIYNNLKFNCYEKKLS